MCYRYEFGTHTQRLLLCKLGEPHLDVSLPPDLYAAVCVAAEQHAPAILATVTQALRQMVEGMSRQGEEEATMKGTE